MKRVKYTVVRFTADIGTPAPLNLYGVMQQRLNVHVHLIVPQPRGKVKAGVGLPASVLIVGDEVKFCSLAREKHENKVLTNINKHN